MYDAMRDVFKGIGEDQKMLGIKFGEKKIIVLRVILVHLGAYDAKARD